MNNDDLLYISWCDSHRVPLLNAGNINQTPDVGSSINSRLASVNAALKSSFSELASNSNYRPAEGYSWQLKDEDDCKKAKPPKPEEEATPFQRVCVEPLLEGSTNKCPAIIQPEVPPSSYRPEPLPGDWDNEFLAILNEFSAEVPPSVAGPSSEHPSPVKILEQAGTAVKRQKPEEPLENMKFTAPRKPLFEPSHLVEQDRTAAKLLKPIAPLVIQKYEVHNSTMKQQVVVSFKDTTTILNDKFGSTKKTIIGYYCKYCLKFMKNKRNLRMHIRTHHMKEKIFKCSICANIFTARSRLKKHMLSIHEYIANK